MMKKQILRVAELFSGIGGWSYALEQVQNDQIDFEVVVAIDFSTSCNAVYSHNFCQREKPKQLNIETLKIEQLRGAEVWLMSPPCQPHSRQGNRLDCVDNRSKAFLRVLELIQEAPPLILCLENVCGFGQSQSFQLLVSALRLAGFSFLNTYHLSPILLGIPNSRPRFYLWALRQPNLKHHLLIHHQDHVWPIPDPRLGAEIKPVSNFLDNINDASLLLPDSLLNADRAWTLDIVDADSTLTACFTRSYGRFARGTGSVLCLSHKAKQRDEPSHRQFTKDWREHYFSSSPLPKIRYFTPREIANFLGFPPTFDMPENIVSRRAQWAALGNSLHVDAAAAIIQVALLHYLRFSFFSITIIKRGGI